MVTSSMNHKKISGQPSSIDGGLSSRQISVNSSSLFEDVSYRQVDSEQREEFAQLLKKVQLGIVHVEIALKILYSGRVFNLVIWK